MKKIGYARVSTDDQSLALQTDALIDIGCDRIFSDQGFSGGIVSRPGLGKALRVLKPGDKLIVWRLDRLGRSLANLIKLLDSLGRKDIRFQSLNESIDTGSPGGRLIFHMMGALAEFERTLISERTRAGMEAARARGKRIGRPPSLSDEQRQRAIRLIDEGLPVEVVATQFRVGPRTLQRLTELKPAI